MGTRANGKRTYSRRWSPDTLHAKSIGNIDQETGKIVKLTVGDLARALHACKRHLKRLSLSSSIRIMHSQRVRSFRSLEQEIPRRISTRHHLTARKNQLKSGKCPDCDTRSCDTCLCASPSSPLAQSANCAIATINPATGFTACLQGNMATTFGPAYWHNLNNTHAWCIPPQGEYVFEETRPQARQRSRS